MFDVKKKAAVISFIGQLMSNPEKFKDCIEFTATREGDAITGTFKATGPLAEFLGRFGDVQGKVEAGNQG